MCSREGRVKRLAWGRKHSPLPQDAGEEARAQGGTGRAGQEGDNQEVDENPGEGINRRSALMPQQPFLWSLSSTGAWRVLDKGSNSRESTGKETPLFPAPQ